MNFITRAREFFATEKAAPPTETKAYGILTDLSWFPQPITLSGASVTSSSALHVPAVLACVTVLSNAISTLPVKLFVRTADGGKEPATEHPAYRLLHRDANPWTSAHQLRSALMVDALTTGNGYALVIRSGETPVEMVRLHPSAVSVEVDRLTGEPVYRVTYANGTQQLHPFTDILHIAAPVKAADGITGLSPVTLAREAIGLSMVLETSAAAIHKNAATPSGVITSPKELGETALTNLLTSWRSAFGGAANRGKVAILEEGARFESIDQNLVESQHLESRQFQILEVCRVFNVPPSLVYDWSRATWNNSESSNRAFLEYSLLPWLREWEAGYRRCLLTDAEHDDYVVEFIVDDFTRADVQARATAYATLRSAGVMTANEVRARENLPSHPEGDNLANPYTTTATTQPAVTNDESGDE